MAFGLYALFVIMRNVINLKNFPEEAESLLKVGYRSVDMTDRTSRKPRRD